MGFIISNRAPTESKDLLFYIAVILTIRWITTRFVFSVKDRKWVRTARETFMRVTWYGKPNISVACICQQITRTHCKKRSQAMTTVVVQSTSKTARKYLHDRILSTTTNWSCTTTVSRREIRECAELLHVIKPRYVRQRLVLQRRRDKQITSIKRPGDYRARRI